jgi:hypothetical protein
LVMYTVNLVIYTVNLVMIQVMMDLEHFYDGCTASGMRGEQYANL